VVPPADIAEDMSDAHRRLPSAAMTDDQTEVFAFLADPATYGLAEPVGRIGTHAAVVFLAGANAYKAKRAVHFPFLDQSSLEKRRAVCEAEVAINRHFTPDLYLGTVPVVRRDGRLHLGGDGEVVEWTVHMRRFDETMTLDLVAERGQLTPDIVARLAALVLQSHARAKVRDGAAATAALGGVVAETLQELRDQAEVFPAEPVRRFAAAMEAEFARLRPLLLDRGGKGRVRWCHGDLHLRNVALIDGAPTLFDAIEFDESIATTDVLYDLAFLIMDLWERGLRAEANLCLNRYLWGSEDPDLEIAGLATFPLFLSLRAAVRAKIAGLRFIGGGRHEGARSEARRYFATAEALLRPEPAHLVAIGGFSGTGKTTLAALMAPHVGRAPGAVHLRSDIVRKRLSGVGELDRLPQTAYTREVSDTVFATLRRQAGLAIAAGQAALVDGVHHRPDEREAIAAVGERAGAAFTGLWLAAPVETLLARVAARKADASDATGAVVAAQAAEPTGPIDWTALDAAVPVGDLLRRALAACGIAWPYLDPDQ
jgi:aminoglycoside phosphotransferase family enzyme/predicted kinase